MNRRLDLILNSMDFIVHHKWGTNWDLSSQNCRENIIMCRACMQDIVLILISKTIQHCLLKGSYYALLWSLDLVWGVDFNAGLFQKHYISHILHYCSSSLSQSVLNVLFSSCFDETLPSKIQNVLWLVSWPRTLWLASVPEMSRPLP